MPNLTLICPTKKLPFDLGMAVMPGVALTHLGATEVTCSQCGEKHAFTLTDSKPVLVQEPAPAA